MNRAMNCRVAKPNKGFTLVELLVAIAIFAVLSALGWKVFDYLIKVKDRNAMHEQNLGQLQEAYLLMQRDAVQMVPLSANTAGMIQPALISNNQRLSFSKAGVSDPLKQSLSPYERIEYVYNPAEKNITRLKYSNLNVTQSTQPLSSVILSDVDDYQISILNPNELAQWPDSGTDLSNKSNIQLLPRGFKVKLKVNEVEYEWLFSLLNTDFLKSETAGQANNASGENKNNEGNSNAKD